MEQEPREHVPDFGEGMAQSFFHGYLRLMLPSPGDERPGLKELIGNYASTHGVQFAATKLFILIPSSAYCPPSVADRSAIMEAAGSLQWRRINRAGVQGRQYHHSVYKIWRNGVNEHPVYACVEYATPMLTLYEIMNQNTDEASLYQRCRGRLVTSFRTTLQRLINNDRECRDLVELIYYKDANNEGNPYGIDELDIGNLILEWINQERKTDLS